MSRRSRSLLLAVLMTTAVALTLLPGAPSSGTSATVTAAAPSDTYSRSKTVAREVLDSQGRVDPASSSSHDVTVEADRTKDLRGRERVNISWRGARPSAGRAPDPYGEKGLQQEYPVVVLQCRGTDDADLSLAKRVRPETCWTSSWSQRSIVNERYSAWTHDRFAAPEDRAPISGVDPYPATCPTPEPAVGSTHVTEFVRRDGTVDPGCSAAQMPPEAGIDAASPPAEVAAFTDRDGNGSVQFEVRSEVENESLGCSHKVACSIVVIPIVGISCDRPAGASLTRAERECRRTGSFKPGESNPLGRADLAVSPSLWWAESNWRNRFSIPITFGLPAGVCDVLDSRAPTKFFGSELMAQAALQWAPAYCLRKDRFNFDLSQMPDRTGWENMESGGGPAAFVSAEQNRVGPDPVGYAPTAITGFSIGYTIDRPDNAGEYEQLRLTPRLIAKLLTQSYVASSLGRGHPGMQDNPVAIMSDPEFTELNPGLSRNDQEAGATLLSLSVSADLMRQLTEYLAQDADAAAFISGKPDPWGMRVNPSYQDVELPLDEWPMLDTYIPPAEGECLKQNRSVYFTQVAAPVSNLRTISEALVDGQPNVQTRCELDASSGLFKLGKVERQGFGTRFMLGLVSLGDADRFGLRSAALLTSDGSYVAPTQKSLSAAIALMDQTKAHQPFAVSQDDVVAAGDAYPGTMVVNTAARLQNLDKAQARQVASFIRIATSEGQVVGRGNGQLPGGYLPLRRTGVTAPLWRAAQETAAAIEAQKVPAKADPEQQDEDGDGGSTPGAGSPPATGEAPAAEGEGKPGAARPGASSDAVVATGATTSTESAAGRFLLPALLLVGGLAIAHSVVSQVAGRRGGRP